MHSIFDHHNNKEYGITTEGFVYKFIPVEAGLDTENFTLINAECRFNHLEDGDSMIVYGYNRETKKFIEKEYKSDFILDLLKEEFPEEKYFKCFEEYSLWSIVVVPYYNRVRITVHGAGLKYDEVDQ